MAGILGLLMSGAGLIKDQYFNLTTLLLPGNGTNGAQNNTFLDSSTNNFTITRNGNTTQGTFSPFSQTGWGNYFSGSGALSIPSSTPNQFGSGDFTIETWYYCSGSIATASQHIFFRRTTAAPIGLIVEIDGSKLNLRAGDSNVSGWEVNIASTTTLVANTWYHLAVSRSGSSWRLFVNGTLEASATASFTIAEETGNIAVATNIPGYLSNWRVLKGVALYTSNFTVPTTPLTAISGTAILTCQSNRFIDNSSNAYTISTSGSPSVVAFSPFAPTAAYTTAAVGGSGYFDGTGDYLTAPSNIVDFAAGQAFTVECWVYVSSNTPSQAISANGANAFSFVISGGQVLYGKSGVVDVLVGTMAAVNQWVHIAVGRNSSNTSRLWVNGTSVATSGSDTYSFNAATMYIGSSSTPSSYLNGYMAGLRVVKGSDVYGVANTSITVPTAPFTAITNTQLLLNFTNAGITDATAKNDLETAGNAQISTSVSKFGGGSISVSSGNYLTAPSNVLLPFGTGDFTIEFWAYWNGGVFTNYATVIDTRNGSFAGGLAIAANITTGAWYVSIAAQEILSTTAAAASWQHVAVTRQGTSLKLFVNGTQAGSTYTSSDNFSNTTLRVGVRPDNQYPWNGYIDDLRITRGLARYTSNFTAPTAPFPVQ